MLKEKTLIESISIASSVENIHLVESAIDRVCQQIGLNEDLYGNVLIAVTEAVTNAIVHGNGSQISLSVFVDAYESETELIFSVKDEGKGFDFDNLPDPTAPENIEKEDGRGIFLMRSLADEVSFDQNGKVVNISFVKI
jgi:serine/threonine-protein kinase RsbW